MRRVTRAINSLILTVLALSLASHVWAKGDLPAAVVGEVTLVLGKATVSGVGGHTPATVGLAIHVNDTIETASSGQVHIRFVDDALVSVRPSSTLEILRYEYSAKNPQDSAVKFNLVEGTARAISGQAAKNARQNFRMNTPIAAIGVRGTDFVVSANNQASNPFVRALVNEGAIVVTPFSGECSAAGFGPCSQNGKELSGLSRQILEITADTAGISSVLLPATNAQAQALVASTAAANKPDITPTNKVDASNKTAKASDSKDVYSDTVTSRAVNTVLTKNEPVKPAEALPPPVPEFTPALTQSAAALTTNTQLVWGRWTTSNLADERISVAYDVAIQGDRKPTVGNLYYALFRAEPAGKSLQPGLGVLAFNLTKAQAQFSSGGTVELMKVGGGKLSLDFDQSQFSTSLQLSHAATGNVTFESSGLIYSGAIFRSSSDTQSMAGTVSLDGKEAGYFFDKTLPNGSIQGITLWSQKP
ncbi:MAG: FecR family protein [Verrucomicrobiota bacterium]